MKIEGYFEYLKVSPLINFCRALQFGDSTPIVLNIQLGEADPRYIVTLHSKLHNIYQLYNVKATCKKGY